MWAPPPHWIIAILLALIAHVSVTGRVFYMRGWRRGAVAIPVCLVVFAVSVYAGSLLDVLIVALDPLPLIAVLAAGIYGTYVVTMYAP
jgi:hypothetical protein